MSLFSHSILTPFQNRTQEWNGSVTVFCPNRTQEWNGSILLEWNGSIPFQQILKPNTPLKNNITENPQQTPAALPSRELLSHTTR